MDQKEDSVMLPDFVLRWIGKDVASKLKLQEGPMGTKPWYQSKTVLAGIVTGLIGIYNAIATAQKWPPIPSYVFTLLGALGVYGRMSATTTIQ